MPQGPIPFTPAKASTSPFAQQQMRVDAQGSQWANERHGRYYAPSYSGFLGICSNQSGVTTSAGLATTYVGICLSNPAGSGRNLSVLGVSATLTVAPAAAVSIGLITGFAAAGVVTHTTPLSPLPGLIGSTSSLVGLVDSACTLPAGAGIYVPSWAGWLAGNIVATNLENTGGFEDLGGSYTLAPGAYLAIGTTVAGPASGFWGSIIWEENPL